MALKDEPGCEKEDDIDDSQDSDTGRLLVRHELVESVTEFREEESDTDDDRETSQLFGKSSVIRSSLLDPKIEIEDLSVKKVENVVKIKQYDLGHHFDPRIATSLNKFSKLRKLAGDSPKASKTSTDSTYEGDIRTSFKRRGVSPHYSDLITNETISKRFIDWHFITENSQFQELSIESTLYNEKEELMRRYPTLESLLMSFGVSGDTLDSLATERYLLTSRREIDTLCQISPVDSMLEALAHYLGVSERFTKYFICFVLDRKIYESVSCDSLWCTKMFKEIPCDDFFQEYFSLVHPHDYFLHHRVIKLISNIQTPLIRRIFFEKSCLSSEEATEILVAEFNNLFDKRRLQDLLYFVLFIYGSEFIPFGDSPATRYFKNCVDDLFNASASDVELSLIGGILGVITKMPS
ncbi:hypothetical protein HG536_0D05670 [Torulaspora globosa]|uniref:Uncharacterized protein n=1 Tax=Torulaspora globosa TaxID=48254 RepID=A0A7G3ZHR0_9SACH|nr:uncharacterized protein HG536_0D05670 [Torulaspora globosa]QLL33046.1 hypothetical protein HG536_0D05670 [Torulaspora globosa]